MPLKNNKCVQWLAQYGIEGKVAQEKKIKTIASEFKSAERRFKNYNKWIKSVKNS